MNINEVVGKRVLITKKEGFREVTVEEVKIIEISPSGNWAKLMNIYGNKYWKPVQGISLVEVLKDLKAGKPPSDT